MGAQARVLRRRIKTVQSTKKITKAMELIAASRIVKAQQRVAAAAPYTTEITKVLTALASNASVEHPLLTPRQNVQRAGVLVITSDRGLAGAYNANVLRLAEQVIAGIVERGAEPVLFVVGRKGISYYRFRGRKLAASWSGFSEQPQYANAKAVSEALVPSFLVGSEGNHEHDEGFGAESAEAPMTAADLAAELERTTDAVQGVDELHIVYTKFRNMLSQDPTTRQLAPVELPDAGLDTGDELRAAYEFEPAAPELLKTLLPDYVTAVVQSAMLEAAASESAARRRAMKAASDNAQDLIRSLTREANQARQADITQEISEIVGGADALAATGSDE
ncbi:MAG TPA: F0F1 ATP synthase subunit gamma [Mycobacteriales bacterium]|jgi:F-type H+-transporting ATPase subunit gamma|nr:F0F1 ATP synthase subunit gamma [Mycobacteriales bacterium]